MSRPAESRAFTARTGTVVQRRVVTLSTCLDAHAAYQVWRRLQTFEVRMAQQCASAAALATALRAHPDVVAVH